MGFINPFTTIVHSPNYLFLALGVKKHGAPSPDAGEILDVAKVPFEKAVNMVIQGRITHGASVALILKTTQYLRDKKLL